MDDLDRKILALLAKNARMPVKEIAEKVALTSPAVSSRIHKLETDGIISGYTVMLNRPSDRVYVDALISLSVAPSQRDELVELFRHIVADGTRSILFSTHITSDLEKCASHIAFIKDGEMLYNGGAADFRERFRDKGETMEDIIVAVERRELDDSAII